LLDSSVISSVNYAEIVTKLTETGFPAASIEAIVRHMDLRVIPASEQQAHAAGMLRPATRRFGLSLGDRFALVLAMEMDLPVLTTEQRWPELELPVGIALIR
jgi:PIN domain nuclease of toxin-antitoxin system